ncbi:sulfhydrogenase 1 subunit delta [Candidatus Micrarchaeota archaeon]|nr:sulfhydrogenase 1 subunit delta [Candidatus Micrarchaeota archaeon]
MIKVGIYSFTSCEGCQISILSLNQKLLDLLYFVDFKVFRLFQTHTRPIEDVDIAVIEGGVSQKKQVPMIKELRKRSGSVVAMGACACFGGIPGLRKFVDMSEDKSIKEYMKRWGSINVTGIANYIDVDYMLYGCPINPNEFYDMMVHYRDEGSFPRQKEQPVCVGCRAKGNECLLAKGIPCLGPITRGGCGAVCPSNGVGCEACRGFLENANIEQFVRYLRSFSTEDKIRSMLFKYTGPSKVIELSEQEKGD